MLAPGMVFDGAGSVDITAGAATAPDFFHGGVGFMNDLSLAVDTDAPAGDVWDGGIRLSPAGAMYGTVAVDPTDVWTRSVRISVIGQLVYEVGAPVGFNSGNPYTSTYAFATS